MRELMTQEETDRPVPPGDGGGELDQPFAVQRSRRDGTVVVALRGELDLHTAEMLLAAASDPNGGLVLDLSELSFVDSAGLRALMSLDLRAQAEGWDFAVAAPTPPVLRLLRLTGFDRRLSILDAPP